MRVAGEEEGLQSMASANEKTSDNQRTPFPEQAQSAAAEPPGKLTFESPWVPASPEAKHRALGRGTQILAQKGPWKVELILEMFQQNKGLERLDGVSLLSQVHTRRLCVSVGTGWVTLQRQISS